VSVVDAYWLLLERKQNQIDKKWIEGIRKSWKIVVGRAKKHEAAKHPYLKKIVAKPPNRRKIMAYLWKLAGPNFRSGKGENREIMLGDGASKKAGLGGGYTTVRFKDTDDAELLRIANAMGLSDKMKPDEQKFNETKMYAGILDEVEQAIKVIDEVQRYLDLLRTDLLINKSMWVRMPAKRGATSGKPFTLEGVRTKVVAELDAADEALLQARSDVRYWKLATHPVRRGMQGDRADEAYDSKEGYDRILRTIAGRVVQGGTEADHIIARKLFAHLSKVAKKAGGTLDWEGHEPDKISIGKMNVVFQDSPMKGLAMRKNHKGEWDPHRGRSPFNRKDYIKHIKHARALFHKKGLSYLWHGMVFVKPKSSRINRVDPSQGVGGSFHISGNYITINSKPSNHIPYLIAHEIGHRYWFKYMDQVGREHFNKWFGKVGSPTHYGSLDKAEDFAEVFAHYVTGKNLRRDQIDRFKSVMGKHRRRNESIRDLLDELTEWKKIGTGFTNISYEGMFGGHKAVLAKEGKQWYLTYKGKKHKMPKRKASFDHAEGLLKTLM
jgi:hypothetical protein